MRTWVSARFHLVIFVYGVNQENKGTGRVLDSGHEIWKTSPQTLFRITFRILSNINDRAYLQKYMECLEIIKLMVVVFMVFFTCGGLILFLWGVVLILRKVFTWFGSSFLNQLNIIYAMSWIFHNGWFRRWKKRVNYVILWSVPSNVSVWKRHSTNQNEILFKK